MSVSGIDYLDRLAALLPGGDVDTGSSHPFRWTVRVDQRPVQIEEILAVADPWLELISQTINQVHRELE